MHILYLGGYKKDYPRHRILIQGLEALGCNVTEVSYGGPYLIKIWKLTKAYLTHSSQAEVVVVGEASNFVMPVIGVLSWLKGDPVFFDTFVSLYDTVLDKRPEKANTIIGKLLYFLDYINFRFARKVFTVSNEDVNYFSTLFNLPEDKFVGIPVGAEDKVFYPIKGRGRFLAEGKFHVLFYGSFIPLHGTKTIIEAASILRSHPDIHFNFIGEGQTLEAAKKDADKYGLTNVTFVANWVAYEVLPDYIAESNVILGIFGESAKASNVVPTKAFQALAMAKPLITGDTRAARSLFVHKENAFLVEPGNAQALAYGIEILFENEAMRTKIATNGYELFKRNYTPIKTADVMHQVFHKSLKT